MRAFLPVVLLAGVLATSVAQAQEPPTPAWPACGDDVVTTRDGGMVRGVIVELVPRERITVKLATGKVVNVPWETVHHVEQGGPIGRACPESPPPNVLDDTGNVTVVIAERGFELEQQVGTQWIKICDTPCERVVPRDRFHRISGSGIQTSPGFRVLGQPGERVHVNVDPGHTAALGLGIGIVTVGVVVTYVGYAMLPVQAIDDDTHWPLPTMIGGLAATLIGGALLQQNIKTRIGQEPSAKVDGPRREDHPAVRIAPGKEASSAPMLRAPRTATLFAVHF